MTRRATFYVLVALIIGAYSLIGIGSSEAASAKQKALPAIVAKCRADLAQRLKLRAQDIKLIEAQPTTWPNTALGMPEIGKTYAQVQTPGWRVILDARGVRYLYTASKKSFRFGGPVALWSYSTLYIKPVSNEPNLNGDLYQCSMLGTNNIRLFSGVTDYYPQEKGVVLVKRRTSRSGHELFFIKAGEGEQAKLLQGAFDFGDVALNSAQDRWAGFVKPRVGAGWQVVVARIGQADAGKQTLPLPEGVRPGQIAWADSKLMILVTKGEGQVCFENTPNADKPAWREIAICEFPKLPDLVLNRSETLDIDQAQAEGKPSVEVARVWFTGNRNVITRINGLTLRGYDLLGWGYLFIWGERDSLPAVYTVNIGTGEVIAGLRGAGQVIKPFNWPPLSTPLGKAAPVVVASQSPGN